MLSLQPYEPELFSRALPCLAAIGCALSPDCAVTGTMEGLPSDNAEDTYIPQPVEIKKVPVPHDVHQVLEKFAEHYHDLWCSQMVRLIHSYRIHYITRCRYLA